MSGDNKENTKQNTDSTTTKVQNVDFNDREIMKNIHPEIFQNINMFETLLFLHQD